MLRIQTMLCLFLLSALPSRSLAQNTATNVHSVRVRETSTVPIIDGVLDDPVWQSFPPQVGSVMRLPDRS